MKPISGKAVNLKDHFILISIPKKPLNHSYDIKTSFKIGISYFCSIISLIPQKFWLIFKVYVENLVEILIFIEKNQFWKNKRGSCKCHLIQYVRSIHVHFIHVLKIQDFYIHHHRRNQQLLKFSQQHIFIKLVFFTWKSSDSYYTSNIWYFSISIIIFWSCWPSIAGPFKSHASFSLNNHDLGSRRWNWKFRENFFNPNPDFLLHSSYSFWPQLSTSYSTSYSGWN